MRRKLVIGLGRHAGTETPGTGASPGTRFLFCSLEEELKRRSSIVRVPLYYYCMDAKRSLRIAFDVLNEVDACIFGLPPHPVDLDAFFLVRARVGRRIPFIYMPLGEFPRGAWFYRHIYQHLGSQDLVVFSSSADRAIHDALVASTPARVAVVPFGIRADSFRTSREARADTRRHLGVESDEVVFVHHGRVTAEKNVHGAIMMFRRLAGEYPRTRLWIIGQMDGEGARCPGPRDCSQLPANPLGRAFRRLVGGGGIGERVSFWGGLPPESLPEILGAADIGVNLTLNGDENFGYSTVEAMAAGLPVIGTDWGGLKDTIDDGVTGFRVPTMITPLGAGVDHWRAWQCAVELVRDPERRRMMGSAARDRVVQAFTLDRFVDSMVAEVHAQVSGVGDISRPPHAWSPLGERLVKRYSSMLAGDPGRTVPIAVRATSALLVDHPLMGEVLAPYATCVQGGGLEPGATLFLPTDLLAVRGMTLLVSDPRHPAKIELVSAADRALVLILKEHGFLDVPSLMREAARRFDRRSIRASLRRLLQTGAILQSRSSHVAEWKTDLCPRDRALA